MLESGVFETCLCCHRRPTPVHVMFNVVARCIFFYHIPQRHNEVLAFFSSFFLLHRSARVFILARFRMMESFSHE